MSKIYLVRGTDYVDYGVLYGGRPVKKNRVIRCCANRAVAEAFVSSYNPFAQEVEQEPDRYTVSDVAEDARYNSRADREVRRVDNNGEFYAKRVSLRIEERDILTEDTVECPEEA